MNQGDSPKVKLARLGFALYLIVGGLYAFGGMYVRALGPCPALSSDVDCYWSPAETLWMFPGSQLVFLAGGIALGVLVRKWTR